MNKPAGAFAGAERGGKAIQWESLLDKQSPVQLDVFFPTLVRSVAGIDTRMVSVIPINTLQAPVTLLRVRGALNVFFLESQLSVSFIRWPVSVQLQLVGARDGQVDVQQILSPGNAADQESNRIVWQRDYYPAAGTTLSSPIGELTQSDYAGIEVDIKVKRRFDRATWMLALVLEGEANANTFHQIGGRLRALFKTSSGI